MTNKNTNRCSNSFAIKDMLIKIRRKHATLLKPIKIRMLKNAECTDGDVGSRNTSVEYRPIHPLQGRFWQLGVKSTLCIPYDLMLPPCIQAQKGTNTKVIKALLWR